MSWTCQYCGKDTSNVDYDYMDGYDHLSCALENINSKKVMKIKNFDKISGFTYKGYSIVNPIHNANETKYTADVINLSLPQKPKWELSVLTPQHKFIVGENIADGIFFISMWDDNRFSATRKMNKQTMKSISNFRQTFEEMVDEILGIQLTSAGVTASSHSLNINVNGNQRMRINSNGHATIGSNVSSGTINTNNYGKVKVTGTGGGIINANNVVWDPNTNLPSSMWMAVKDLQEQIDNLKNNNANNK
jgi:hypothetical protein